MNYVIFLRPLVGAGIGYITNWIAVKMMFRPLKPVMIGSHKLPFTPGIIPSNKKRIASAVGDVISDSLLTDEVLKQYFLSDEMRDRVRSGIVEVLNSIAEKESTIKIEVLNMVDDGVYDSGFELVCNKVTERILLALGDADIGSIVTEQIVKVTESKLQGSMLGFFGGNAIISKVAEGVPEQINNYIAENGQEFVYGMVKSEFNSLMNKSVAEVSLKIAESDIDLVSGMMKIYEKFVLEKLSDLIKMINISEIVAERIDSMDVLELEKLILRIMKKELNALVNLGAVIGFLLGLLNLLF